MDDPLTGYITRTRTYDMIPFVRDCEGYRNLQQNANFEAFTAVIFQVEVFWVLTPCSVRHVTSVSEVHSVSILTTFTLKRCSVTV
jgi:hypothetical protein